MLSNFETPNRKLIQIILAAQPQLAEKLASPSLAQLRQRISIVARLKPFTISETNQYVGHRLGVAGYDLRTHLFTPRAGAMIAESSHGIPRNINNICFNALSLGCALKRKPIDESIIREVLGDLDLDFEDLPSEDGMTLAVRQQNKAIAKAAHVGRRTDTRIHQRIWLSRLATAAALMLVLMWPLGMAPGNTEVFASQPETSPSSRGIHSNGVGPTNSKESEGKANDVPAPKTLVPEGGHARISIGSHDASKSLSLLPAGVPNSQIDPSRLWAQVANESSSAEVALARLYLNGIGVPQSCQQARVLLLAASKKGNGDAQRLLSDDATRCQ
jgi:hypothetical protein